jgi:hypothetical protein
LGFIGFAWTIVFNAGVAVFLDDKRATFFLKGFFTGRLVRPSGLLFFFFGFAIDKYRATEPTIEYAYFYLFITIWQGEARARGTSN